MPTTYDADQSDQEHYNFMQERRRQLVRWFLWMLFLCIVLIGLIWFLPKF